MAEIIECPKCQRKLRMHEADLGQTVQCPSCQNTFIATSANREAPPRSVDEEGPVYRPREEPRPRYDEPPLRPRYDTPLSRHDEDYDDYRGRPRNRFGDYRRAHRGVAVLTLGIISLFICYLPPGFVLAIVAVVMGALDLAAMNRGEMMDDGRGQTRAGLICGIIALLLGPLGYCTCFGFGLFSD